MALVRSVRAGRPGSGALARCSGTLKEVTTVLVRKHGSSGTAAEPGQISTRQSAFLLLLLIVGSNLHLTPVTTTLQAGRDAWLAYPIGFLLDGAFAFLYQYVGSRFPGMTMAQFPTVALGPLLGKVVAAGFVLYFFISTAFSYRDISALNAQVLLPNTPIWALILLGVVATSYLTSAGLEVLARLSELLTPVFVLGLFITVGLALKDVDPGRIRPILEHGWGPPAAAALVPNALALHCSIINMIMPYNRVPAHAKRAKLTALGIGMLMMMALTAGTIAAFGPEQAPRLTSATMSLARYVDLAGVVQRLDLLWLLVWIAAKAVMVAALQWAVALGAAQVLGLSDFRPLILPVAALSGAAGAVILPEPGKLLEFVLFTYPFFSLVTMGLSMSLIGLVAWFRGYKSQASRHDR